CEWAFRSWCRAPASQHGASILRGKSASRWLAARVASASSCSPAKSGSSTTRNSTTSRRNRQSTSARVKVVTTRIPPTQGVLLAGGLARRMGGGDKPMRTIGGRTILERVITRLLPQCSGLILNANGDPARFASFGLQVIADNVPDFPGPLAGILAALDWTATNRPEIEWVLSAAGDCPFLPRD